jgi:hypothetical protein
MSWCDVGQALPWLLPSLRGQRDLLSLWPKLRAENAEIADLLVGLTDSRKTSSFGLRFLYLRNVKGHLWNHKRVYCIYCELELSLRIKRRKRLKRDKADALAVPDASNMTWSMDFMADRLGVDSSLPAERLHRTL